VPYVREGEGLHLPPVREALNRVCPDIKHLTRCRLVENCTCNRPCLVALLARDACAPTVSAKWEQVYTELLGGGSMVLQTAPHRNKATVDKQLDSGPSPNFSGTMHSSNGCALLALLYCPMRPDLKSVALFVRETFGTVRTILG
jgi:hypothetical protein